MGVGIVPYIRISLLKHPCLDFAISEESPSGFELTGRPVCLSTAVPSSPGEEIFQLGSLLVQTKSREVAIFLFVTSENCLSLPLERLGLLFRLEFRVFDASTLGKLIHNARTKQETRYDERNGVLHGRNVVVLVLDNQRHAEESNRDDESLSFAKGFSKIDQVDRNKVANVQKVGRQAQEPSRAGWIEDHVAQADGPHDSPSKIDSVLK
jgi:hypothetical protein